MAFLEFDPLFSSSSLSLSALFSKKPSSYEEQRSEPFSLYNDQSFLGRKGEGEPDSVPSRSSDVLAPASNGEGRQVYSRQVSCVKKSNEELEKLVLEIPNSLRELFEKQSSISLKELTQAFQTSAQESMDTRLHLLVRATDKLEAFTSWLTTLPPGACSYLLSGLAQEFNKEGCHGHTPAGLLKRSTQTLGFFKEWLKVSSQKTRQKLIFEFVQTLGIANDHQEIPVQDLVQSPSLLEAFKQCLQTLQPEDLQGVVPGLAQAFKKANSCGRTSAHLIMKSSEMLNVFIQWLAIFSLKGRQELISAVAETLGTPTTNKKETPIHRLIQAQGGFNAFVNWLRILPPEACKAFAIGFTQALEGDSEASLVSLLIYSPEKLDYFKQCLYFVDLKIRQKLVSSLVQHCNSYVLFDLNAKHPNCFEAFIQLIQETIKHDGGLHSDIINHLQSILDNERLDSVFRKKLYTNFSSILENSHHNFVTNLILNRNNSDVPKNIIDSLIPFLPPILTLPQIGKTSPTWH